MNSDESSNSWHGSGFIRNRGSSRSKKTVDYEYDETIKSSQSNQEESKEQIEESKMEIEESSVEVKEEVTKEEIEESKEEVNWENESSKGKGD